MHHIDYNTQQPHIIINEFGRNIQGFIQHILEDPDKQKRTRKAYCLVAAMISLNPQLKELEDCENIVWDYIHIIADYKLDVDTPYPKPDPALKMNKPAPLSYPTQSIKYRYYGANLQMMIDKVADIENPEFKQMYLDMLGSFMKNSGKNWNDEAITTEQIVAHLNTLSNGKINISVDDINADIELRQRTSNNFHRKKGKSNNRFTKHNNSNSYKKRR